MAMLLGDNVNQTVTLQVDGSKGIQEIQRFTNQAQLAMSTFSKNMKQELVKNANTLLRDGGYGYSKYSTVQARNPVTGAYLPGVNPQKADAYLNKVYAQHPWIARQNAKYVKSSTSPISGMKPENAYYTGDLVTRMAGITAAKNVGYLDEKSARSQFNRLLSSQGTGFAQSYAGMGNKQIGLNSILAETMQYNKEQSVGLGKEYLNTSRSANVLNKSTNALTKSTSAHNKVQKEQMVTLSNSAAKAFSLHIALMYLQPAVDRLTNAFNSNIQSFAEFEKMYVNYEFKSLDSVLGAMSPYDTMRMASGEVFTHVDAAQVAERVAASGEETIGNEESMISILKLATTAQMDYNDATNLAVKSTAAMSLGFESTTRIIDAQALAADRSTAEVQDLAKWFRYAAGFASQAGVEVEQLAGHLAVLDQMGTPDAGVYYRQMQIQFKKDDVRTKFMSQYGFSEDAFMDTDVLLEQLREIYQSSSNQDQTLHEMQRALGGRVTAQQALSNLVRAEQRIWDNLVHFSQEDAAGYSAKTYEALTNNYIDQTQKLNTTIQIFKASLGEGITPVLTTFLKVLVPVVEWFTELPKPLRTGIAITIGFAAAVGTLTVSVVKFGTAIFAINTVLETFGNVQRTRIAQNAVEQIQTMNLTKLTRLLSLETARNTAANIKNAASKFLMQGTTGSLSPTRWSSPNVGFLSKNTKGAVPWSNKGVSSLGVGGVLGTQGAGIAQAAGSMLSLAGAAMSYSKVQSQIEQGNFQSARSYQTLTTVLLGAATAMFALQALMYMGPAGLPVAAGILGIGALATLGVHKYMGYQISDAETKHERSVFSERGERIRSKYQAQNTQTVNIANLTLTDSKAAKEHINDLKGW